MKKGSVMLIILLLFINLQVFGQGLFEDALSGSTEDEAEKQASYKLNGYLRGTFYGGKVPAKSEAEMKSGYGEASLKLKVSKKSFGDGFAEIRFRKGHEFGREVDEVDIREAYINNYVGRFDFRIGHQIVVWGRADGINPTDNITPKDFLVRSPDEDDRRVGNFLIRSFYNVQPIRFEAIWMPFYAVSVIPTDVVPLPSNIILVDPQYPDANLKNNSIALRLNFEWPSLDGSVSYFNGLNPGPGLDIVSVDSTAAGMILNISPRAYRMHILGADFSTTISDFGLRGELAYRYPHGEYKDDIYIPNPDFQYVIGFDHEFSTNTSLILQYIGRYVFDYSKLTMPALPAAMPQYQLSLKNRLISFQTNEITHSISFRPAWTFLYETLTIEAMGMYNFTTEELLLRPELTYDITDALSVTFGGEIYSGPDESLFGSVESYLSAVYFELKSSF